MCGIYGALGLKRGARPAGATLSRMAAACLHRGPDDEGRYVDADILLGMRRLSIIDVAGGHQPIANEDATVHVVCNGEIYNYRELTAELTRAGHRFATRSDTEVLVHLYEEHGDAFVTRLNGMFAFALWDARRRRLLIGRDRLGIKPLYYREDGATLTFASEAKSILAATGTTAALDRAALAEYLALGYVAAPASLFEGIRKLPPGCLLSCAGGHVHVARYWAPSPAIDESLDEAGCATQVRGRLERAVVSQMVSDVPLGAFLSGGIDSSAIVAFMARHSREPIRTYSIGFEANRGAAYYNELPWARQIARLFGTDHHEIVVKPDVVRLLPRLLWHLDEPVADAAFITTYLVAEFARRDVTVILSGVGGDELFGGYRRYLGAYYDAYYERIPRWLRSGVLQPVLRALPSDRHSALLNLARHARTYALSHDEPFEERYRSYVNVFSRLAAAEVLRDAPGGRRDALDAAFAEVAGADSFARAARVDLVTQLPDDLLMLTDKATMAASLECRVPFLDNDVVDLALRVPSRLKIRGRSLKHLLKQALADVLPGEILRRRKRGFGAPIGAWFRSELAWLVRRVLSRAAVEDRGLFDWPAVERTIALHEASRQDNTDRLLALTSAELWCRLYLDGRSPEEVTADLTEARVAEEAVP